MDRAWIAVTAVFVTTACGEDVMDAVAELPGLEWLDASKHPKPDREGKELRVMTRNLYLGTDVGVLLQAPSPAAVPALVEQAFTDVEGSLPEERLQAIADELEKIGPHLVGLQEVALIRTQSPGDAATPTPTPADDVAFDFLELLLEALEERGLVYDVVAVSENADVELPSASGEDVRLTDRDVLLARRDVEIENAEDHQFATNLTVQVGGPGGPAITIVRGWVEADATVNGITVHVANTHLEPAPVEAIVPIQVAQANELIAALEEQELPTVLLGDFNSAADGSTTPTYFNLRLAGYLDAWMQDRPSNPGFTCCQAADLRNEASLLDERIDLILVRQPDAPKSPVILAEVDTVLLGEEQRDKTPSGLWPSDHAGVAARFRLSQKKPHVDLASH